MQLPEGTFLKSLKGDRGEVIKEVRALESGYIRITVDNPGYSDGYLIVEKGEVIGAYRFSDGELHAQEAYELLMEDVQKDYSVITVHELTQEQLELVKEYYPEAIIREKVDFEVKRVDEEDRKKEEKAAQIVQTARRMVSEPRRESKKSRRDELLKKYGIQEPSDEFINAILFDYALHRKSMKDIANEVKERIEKGISKIPKIKKWCVVVTAGRDGGALELIVNINATYSGGITGKRDPYLEEKMREDLQKISKVLAGEISERFGIETKMKCIVDFKVKGLI